MSTYLTPFTPIQPFFDAPAAADTGGHYDQSSLLAFLMNDDFATDAFFAYGDHAAADNAPAFSGVSLPPAAAPPAAMSNGRKRSFAPTADDEAATAGASRSPAVRRKSSPPASPAHSGGDAAPAGRGGGRRVWVRERSTEWWDHLSSPACPDAEFRQAFRMSRATFDALCDELSAAVAKEDTALRAAIPVHQRVAVCLWRLATGEPLREVSRRFGLGISTCHNIVLQVCAALTAVLLPKTVRWPLDLDTPAASFQAASGIPGVVGALCTDHIPIGPPKDNVADYYNRRLTERNNKASYSVAVQAVVDADGAFTDVCIGLPGSLSDAAVLERSALHAKCQSGMMLGDQCRLVGGASYPLTDWMLVPYAHHNLTWAQHAFNAGTSTGADAAICRPSANARLRPPTRRGASPFGALPARSACRSVSAVGESEDCEYQMSDSTRSGRSSSGNGATVAEPGRPWKPRKRSAAENAVGLRAFAMGRAATAGAGA